MAVPLQIAAGRNYRSLFLSVDQSTRLYASRRGKSVALWCFWLGLCEKLRRTLIQILYQNSCRVPLVRLISICNDSCLSLSDRESERE